MLKTFFARLGILGELLGILWKHKIWWLLPLMLVLVGVGLLIVFGSSSPIAPFIYTLF